MSIPSLFLSGNLVLVTNILFFIILGFVAYYTPWYKLKNGEYRNVFFGAVVGAIVLWNIEAGALPALNFHYTGIMVLTLMFRWQYAIWALLLVTLSEVYMGKIGWDAYAMNSILYTFVSVYVANLIYKFVDRKMPEHFFIYVYGCGFFGAAIVIVFVVAATSIFLFSVGVYEWSSLVRNFIRYTPLMMFVEAFISGLLITLLVVFKPRWVTTFDDDKYIRGK